MSVSSRTRHTGVPALLCGSYRRRGLLAALLVTTVCLWSPGALAQVDAGIILGGTEGPTGDSTVCVNSNNRISFVQDANAKGDACNQPSDVNSNGKIIAHTGDGNFVWINLSGPGNVDATGTITGSTLTDGTAVITGGNISQVQNITGDGTGSISNFASISGTAGSFGTLSTTGNASIGGNLDMNGNDINNVGTLNATTVNATTGNITNLSSTSIVNSGNTKTGSLTVDSNATVGGTLAVTGVTTTNGISNTGNIATDTLSTTGNASIGGNLDMTGGNINNVATLNSTNIVNSGNTKTGSLTVDNNATIGGNLSVAGLTSTNGIDNNNAGITKAGLISGVADPIAGTDAANKQYVDTGLAKAFKEIDRNTQGIAIAMAMGGLSLPDTKTFALGANLGFFDNKQALAVQGALRLTPFVSVSGGVGVGLDGDGTVGGRVGAQVAW